jgi:hypothetical protein
MRLGRKQDHHPLPAGSYPHDARQVLVEAMHPQAVQVDASRFHPEIAALCNHAVNLQVSDPRKIRIGVGKCASSA